MGVLLLRLAGPMQSWGDSSRFPETRSTRREPTKSGVVGLLAAALGRMRGEAIDDLAALEFAVRVDQPGFIIRDFQTERPAVGKSMPLTNRYYLADAAFLAALAGPNAMLAELDRALRAPRWPLFLGRRTCPVDLPVSLGVLEDEDDVRLVLSREPWLASEWFKRKARGEFVRLELICDARDGEAFESHSDYPVSFGAHRRYAPRAAVRLWVDNPDMVMGVEADIEAEKLVVSVPEHDPLGCL